MDFTAYSQTSKSDKLDVNNLINNVLKERSFCVYFSLRRGSHISSLHAHALLYCFAELHVVCGCKTSKKI